ncbi:MAG TPA: YciI family protein [Chloroflexota bacterium]|nr:YciI family protein [Chloroflexota bacterium]
MRYALLIHVDEAVTDRLSQEDQSARYAAYGAFSARYKDKIQGGNALMGVGTATTVRTRDSHALTTDGPFAETKEQLNGFYLVACNDLDEAVEIASQIPDAVRGAIEVRPIMEFNQA